MFDILIQIANQKNEHTPYRITSACGLGFMVFKEKIAELEKNGLIQINQNPKNPWRGHKRIFLTTRGITFIESYRKCLMLAGEEEQMPDVQTLNLRAIAN